MTRDHSEYVVNTLKGTASLVGPQALEALHEADRWQHFLQERVDGFGVVLFRLGLDVVPQPIPVYRNNFAANHYSVRRHCSVRQH